MVRLFGVTSDEHSVCCHVTGFRPYLFALAPDNFPLSLCGRFQTELENATIAEMRSVKGIRYDWDGLEWDCSVGKS